MIQRDPAFKNIGKNSKDMILRDILKTRKPQYSYNRMLWDESRKEMHATYFIYPTHECNFRCSYCFYKQTGYGETKMTDETIDNLIRFLSQWETAPSIGMHFFGGEPFYAFDVIKKVVLKAKEILPKYGKKVQFSATTNGSLIMKDKVLDFIKEHFRNPPFLLSLDGPEHIQNLNRKFANGVGTFKSIPYKEFLKLWPKLEVRPTYTKEMLPKLMVESYKWLTEQGFKATAVEFDYEPEWKDKDIDNLIKAVWEINDYWYSQIKKGNIIVKPKFIKEVEQLFYTDRNQIVDHKLCGRCHNSMGIASDGKIYPCQRWTGYTYENIPEEFVVGNVKEGVDLDLIYYIQQINRKDMTPPEGVDCEVCAFRGSCQGGCNAMNWFKWGDRYQLDPELCKIKKKIFQESTNWMMSRGYFYEQIQPRLRGKRQKYQDAPSRKEKVKASGGPNKFGL